MRPCPAIPVSAAAEVRAVEGPAGLKIQPSAFLVTELAPVVLPVELQAEIYAQAGYVGGAFATPFADGQLRVDRALAEIGRITARIGAGAWGGAQKGAARLDVGPAATIWLPVSRSGGARLALDWRLRVAGDAKPESGPALTLSGGFSNAPFQLVFAAVANEPGWTSTFPSPTFRSTASSSSVSAR
jgi:hypothetical protein